MNPSTTPDVKNLENLNVHFLEIMSISYKENIKLGVPMVLKNGSVWR